MSVQFGRWHFESQSLKQDDIERVVPLLARYGPDNGGSYQRGGVHILYRAFHVTEESRCERQPYVTNSNVVLTWDGRLDNRSDLVGQLQSGLRLSASDVEIVATAYQVWGLQVFSKLIGDWALSVWDPKVQSLVLAKDPIGPRFMYYTLNKEEVRWSSLIDPLVLFIKNTFSLDEEYIAGWLGSFPAAHLTPYLGIQAVPPSCFVLIRPGTHVVKKHWEFDSRKSIRYRTDAEYEEHFRTVFAQSVHRRLRSAQPVLAELSGGMDSSSIVCMADLMLANGGVETPRIDTVSYYDDSEPNWNERPYFTTVEQKRGQIGRHIDVASHESSELQGAHDGFAAMPASIGLSTET